MPTSASLRGRCGRWINAELLPHTAGIVDDLALVKSVFTNAINHDPACTYVMTGNEVPGKASLGSWLAYGLGSESDDLPAFVVFTPQPDINPSQALFTRMWSSGFLPTRYTGVALRVAGGEHGSVLNGELKPLRPRWQTDAQLLPVHRRCIQPPRPLPVGDGEHAPAGHGEAEDLGFG